MRHSYLNTDAMPTIRRFTKRKAQVKSKKTGPNRGTQISLCRYCSRLRNRQDSRACTYVTDQEYPFPHQCPDGQGRCGGGGCYVRVKKARKRQDQKGWEIRKGVKKGKGGNEKEKAICHAPSVAKKKKGREGYQPARRTAYFEASLVGSLDSWVSLASLTSLASCLGSFLGSSSFFCSLASSSSFSSSSFTSSP